MPQPYPNGELVIVIDCSDLDRSARFWSGVLGYTARPRPAPARPAATGTAASSRRAAPGSTCCCSGCPTSSARRTGCIWTCARPISRPRSGGSLGLGATLLTSEPVTEDGWFWHILADPDGNEFCVLQPPGMPSP